MALTKHPCKNHPEKFTSRRCYYCKDYICQACHQTLFHHLFCSFKHALIWKIKDVFSIFTIRKDLAWFVLIVILSNVVLYNLLVSRLDDVDSSLSAVSDSNAFMPMPEDFIIDSVRYAVRGKFSIQISGIDDVVLNLSLNNRFVETLLPGEKEFSFDDISLQKGKNKFAVWGMNTAGKSILIDSFSVNYKSPRLDWLMQPVYKVRKNNKHVALTFDGGSSNRGTAEILKILRDNKIQSTMFLTGNFVKNFPGLTKQIIADGHEVGNHSLNHPHLTNIEIDGQNNSRLHVDRLYIQDQLNKTDSIYSQVIKNNMMPYWRAPFGEINREILLWAAEIGYRHIGWSYRCDSWDWVADKTSELYRSSEKIKQHFLEMEEEKGLDGKILLMHLGSERTDDFPFESLESLILELQNRGYTFKKVSQMLKVPNV